MVGAGMVRSRCGIDGLVGCRHIVEGTQEEVTEPSIGESRSPSSQILLNRK
jgi:hypothetical protein